MIIHYEPIQKDTISYAISLDNTEGKISQHYGEAPYFAIVVVSANDRKVKNRQIISNPFISEERGKGILVSEFLIKQGIDVLLVKKRFDSRGPEYVLSDSNIQVIIISAETLDEALQQQSLLL